MGVRLLYPRPRGKRLRTGVKLLIDPKDRWIDLNIALRSEYEPGTIQLIEKFLPAGGVFLDVGANIGVMSTFAAIRVGPNGMVFAFEPDDINFGRLVWARNANKLPQMIPMPIALGDETALVLLRRDPSGDGGLTSLSESSGFSPSGLVPTIRLDNFCNCFAISRVDLIKIDVEGYERNVIDGAVETLRNFRPKVIIEMINSDAVQAGQKLIDMGYRSYVAGSKSERWDKTLTAVEPQVLENNNMIFVFDGVAD